MSRNWKLAFVLIIVVLCYGKQAKRNIKEYYQMVIKEEPLFIDNTQWKSIDLGHSVYAEGSTDLYVSDVLEVDDGLSLLIRALLRG